ncbi:MAG TPA: hypothetical protein VF770_07185, partial [Solirubrobacterales bacterium]
MRSTLRELAPERREPTAASPLRQLDRFGHRREGAGRLREQLARCEPERRRRIERRLELRGLACGAEPAVGLGQVAGRQPQQAPHQGAVLLVGQERVACRTGWIAEQARAQRRGPVHRHRGRGIQPCREHGA